MAEKDKPAAESKSAAGNETEWRILFKSFIFDIVLLGGAKFAWDMLLKFLGENADVHIAKPNHLRIFAEAMNQLQVEDRAKHDTIEHFMAAPDGLNNDPTDLEDFQIRSARIGGDEIAPTVAFLKRVAEPHQHAERRAFLGRYGIIGPRAVDAHEKALNFIIDVKDAMVSAGVIAGITIAATPAWVDAKIKELGQDIKAADAAFQQTTEGQAMIAEGQDKTAKLKARLAALKK